MGTKDRVKSFFRRVVVEYNCRDIQTLLGLKLDIAAPLLACVVNGIDMLGGMKAGFSRNNSRQRSIKFLKEHMHVSDEQAQLLYELVRCGITHEGVPKGAISFFVEDARVDPGRYLYRNEAGAIYLNVTELARQYLVAVDEIAEDPGAYLTHVPPIESAADRLLAGANVNGNIDEFCERLAEKNSRRGESGELHTSASPFFPEFLAGFTVRHEQGDSGTE